MTCPCRSQMKDNFKVAKRQMLLEQQLKAIKGELAALNKRKRGGDASQGTKGDGGDGDGETGDENDEDDDADTAKLEAKIKACAMPPESAKVRCEITQRWSC